MITVVFMHWQRPKNSERLAWHYQKSPHVRNVILWDAAGIPLTEFAERPPSKTRYINSQCDFGLYGRFAAGALAFADPVLMTDDDILLPDDTLASLENAWLADPNIVHGILGRQPSTDGTYNCNGPYAAGPCDIILTRAAMTSRWICGAALANGSRVLDALPGTKPRGNGEDIVMSYTAMRASGRQNHAHASLAFENLPGAFGSESISVRAADHQDHRTGVVRWCRSNLLPD